MKIASSSFLTQLLFVSTLTVAASTAQAQQINNASSSLTPLPGSEFLQTTIAIDHNDDTTCALKQAGDVFCWNEDFGAEALNHALNNDIAAIELTNSHLCGIGNSSGVACIFKEDSGSSASGMANPPEPDASYIAMSSANSFARNICAIQSDNRTVCWGRHASINNVPAEALYLKQVEVYIRRACGIDLNDSLICWGEPSLQSGIDQQFGDVDPNDIGLVKDISLSSWGACIIDADDKLECYRLMSDFTDEFSDVSLASIKVQNTFRTVLCYETTGGDIGCDTLTNAEEEDSPTLVSDLPVDSSPRLISYDISACILDTDNQIECYFRADEPFGLFPDAPQQLRSEVYSSNTLELFWDRPEFLNRSLVHPTGYEIYRDGVLIQRFSNIVSSFFDLNADINAAYEVRSILGMVGGGSARVVPSGNPNELVDSNVASEASTTENVDTNLFAPQLMGQVYSSSAIEISWKRQNNPNVRYNIYRDSVLIRANSDAASLFDSGLAANTTYDYALETILNDSIVASASIALTTRRN